MAFVLRKIRQTRWETEEGVGLVTLESIPSDPLGDLQTSGGKLSLWVIEDDHSNLERVIAALASTCSSLSNFDYALFDMEVLDGLGLAYEHVDGASPDHVANVKWHRDLVGLTGMQILRLAERIWSTSERRRVGEREVGRMIASSVEASHLNASQVSSGVLKHLSKNKPV